MSEIAIYEKEPHPSSLGITCYSLQNHLRTSVPDIGQVETDELYVGVDARGCQYVIPVQAKGGSDTLNIVQIEQDMALCESRFPALVCRRWPHSSRVTT